MTFSYVYPPDIGGDPHIKIGLVEFRDRNFITDTGSDQSSSVQESVDDGVEDAIGVDVNELTGGPTRRLYVTRPGKIKRIGTIYLPLPSGLQNQYAIGWEMADMQLIESVKDAFNNQDGGFAGLGNIGAGIASTLYGDIARRFTGSAPNPRKQAIFQSIEPRSFSFQYSFNPKSESDARDLQQLLRAIKAYSLPSETNWEAFYDFPVEFQIEFANVDKESFPEPAYCVCTGITSNFDTDGRIQIMSDGRPATVNFTMEFLETELKTRQNPG